MKITSITPWPPSCDYPIFRRNLSKLKKHIDQVIVGLTDQQHKVDLKKWLGKNLKAELVSMPSSMGKGDWRNVITHRMLKEVRNQWVLSLEQDFLIKDYDDFFSRVKTAARVNDVVTFQEGNRFHPGLLLCRKKALN
jgi:hypothetical protein